MSDEAQSVAGDVTLHAAMIDLYPKMRRFAACAADSDLDPDDLVQEAFTRVFQHAAQAGPPDHLDAYLRRSILNLIANERRSRSRARVARPRAQSSQEPTDPIYPSHTAAVLEAASPTDRALVYLVDVEGLAISDAAAVLELSPVAARARVSRARRRLRAVLVAERRLTSASTDSERANDRHGS